MYCCVYIYLYANTCIHTLYIYLVSLPEYFFTLKENEKKFANTYYTKPLLFGELKDRSKSFGILDKFEEGKKRAKDKGDRYIP